MKLSGYVRRGDNYRIGLLLGVYFCVEVLLFLPFVIKLRIVVEYNLTKEGSATISKRSLQSQFDFLRLNLLTIGM